MSTKQKKQQEQTPAKKSKASGSVKKAAAQEQKPSLIQRAVTYFTASKLELTKVSWPLWKEVKATGIAVAALVVVMSVFLGVVDLFLSWLVKSILP